MSNSQTSNYKAPDEPVMDKALFRKMCASIKKHQQILINTPTLSYSQIMEHKRSVIFMRKECNRLNTRYRLARPIP